MNKYIKALNEVEVFASYENQYEALQKLQPNELIRFSREKRRNGVNWMEVYVNDQQKGYIKKNKKDIFVCEYAKMDDAQSKGLSYQVKNGTHLSIAEIFKPVVFGEHLLPNHAKTELSRTRDFARGEDEYMQLQYDENVVDVSQIVFYKNEKFYVTQSDFLNKDFLHIDNLQGKKAIMLPNTTYTKMKERWMKILSIVIIAVISVITLFILLLTGWIVKGFILLIPGIIIAAIFRVLIRMLLMLLDGIFNQIRKLF